MIRTSTEVVMQSGPACDARRSINGVPVRLSTVSYYFSLPSTGTSELIYGPSLSRETLHSSLPRLPRHDLPLLEPFKRGDPGLEAAGMR
jgi:hypothetical protein